MSCAPLKTQAGLSPLARGTREHGKVVVVLNRFIPAGAGNTMVDNLVFLILTVYPRWRGEHELLNYRHPQPEGLSPLARGTL